MSQREPEVTRVRDQVMPLRPFRLTRQEAKLQVHYMIDFYLFLIVFKRNQLTIMSLYPVNSHFSKNNFFIYNSFKLEHYIYQHRECLGKSKRNKKQVSALIAIR